MPNKTLKPLPNIAQDLPPLNPDHHPYFSPAHERTPFAAHPGGGIAWSNAWWLAEFSLLAYCDKTNAKRGLEGSGFSMRDAHFVSRNGSQALVAESPEAIVVAFRGTEVAVPGAAGLLAFIPKMLEAIADWKTDAKAVPTPFDNAHPARGRVHTGFMDYFSAIDTDVHTAVHTLLTEKPGRAVWYTGHSLGGALAILAAARFGDATGLYTFGCPRVGNSAFTQSFPAVPHVARFAGPGDPVTVVPPTLPFGYTDSSPAIWMEAPGILLPPADLRRHAPMRYCSTLWNFLAGQGL